MYTEYRVSTNNMPDGSSRCLPRQSRLRRFAREQDDSAPQLRPYLLFTRGRNLSGRLIDRSSTDLNLRADVAGDWRDERQRYLAHDTIAATADRRLPSIAGQALLASGGDSRRRAAIVNRYGLSE